MMDLFADYGKIIIADIILSGDNALVVAMAAAGLPEQQRAKAIYIGMAIAAILRIVFAIIATSLLGIPGLLFVGAVLLFYVCWTLYQELRGHAHNDEAGAIAGNQPQKTMFQALTAITIADVTMSLDNVLAVASIADGDQTKLIFGLALAIILMTFAATFIVKLLARYPAISWFGLVVLIYVAVEMFYRGFVDVDLGVGPMLGLMEGWATGKGGH